MSKALIAMSGGVDSSVAAYLMQQQGFECIGCTMKLYQNEDAGISKSHTCCSLDDVEDARAVAYKLGMQYYSLSIFTKRNQKNEIFRHFYPGFFLLKRCLIFQINLKKL